MGSAWHRNALAVVLLVRCPELSISSSPSPPRRPKESASAVDVDTAAETPLPVAATLSVGAVAVASDHTEPEFRMTSSPEAKVSSLV